MAVLALPTLLAAAGPARSTPPADPQVSSSVDPIEAAYRKLLEKDDEAQADMDRWIREASAAEAAGDKTKAITLRARLRQRLDEVKKAYEDFLRLHPDHVNARVAYGSFLSDIGEEQACFEQWEKARKMAPADPAIWNNLANWYAHNGGISNSFAYYTKAIELDPKQALYYWNLAVVVYMFRDDAAAYYKIPRTKVLDKAIELYRQAVKLDPENFILATDYAQSYYAYLLPPPNSGQTLAEARKKQLVQEALAAWQNAFKLARDEIEREGVRIHLARVSILGGQFEEARRQLEAVTNGLYLNTKQLLLRKIEAASEPDAPPVRPASQ